MLTAGIKYCGGCMPVYDRVQTCREIQERCPDIQWEYVKDGSGYDIILVMQGCPRKCAVTEEPRLERVTVSCPEEADAAVSKIQSAIFGSKKKPEES